MQIVIDISEDLYLAVRKGLNADEIWDLRVAVTNGALLPKGHERLFDERDIVNGNYEIIGNRIYELEPIIEADKEE